jgi:DNA repair exonuclease SbcCD ATPase subunit
MDALDDPSRVAALETRAAELGLPLFRISGATGEGVSSLLEAMWRGLFAEVSIAANRDR